MIIGGSKKEVIANIQKNVQHKEWNRKVEVNDPVFSEKEREKAFKRFYGLRKHRVLYFFESRFAYLFVDILGRKLNQSIQIEGLENLSNIQGGAIVTSNHFNPLDNMAIRKVIKKQYKKNIYIVSQETNLAMPGFLGYLMNSLHIIPLCKSPHFIDRVFRPELQKVLAKHNYVLIYPEEEMWFNYRKPRPCKRGAYQFAAEANVPILSCFVEIVDLEEDDNEEFRQVKYIVHVLKPIFPNPQLSARENGKAMAALDYQQKVEAYEKAYHKRLDDTFSFEDIAGYKYPKSNQEKTKKRK